jgi:LysM repeat protein
MTKLLRALALIVLFLAVTRPVYADIPYTVQAGETIFSIGRRFGINPWAIVAANHLSNANLIYPGQVLVIPGVTGDLASTAPISTDRSHSRPTHHRLAPGPMFAP